LSGCSRSRQPARNSSTCRRTPASSARSSAKATKSST
jgi:hypothetical protein